MPYLNVEETSDIEPTQSGASVSEGWGNKQDHFTANASDLSTADPNTKAVVKELVEKHTIEVVNLENKLQNKEASKIKAVLTEFENKKAKAVEHEREALSKLITTVDQGAKMEALANSAHHMEGVLADIEEKKMKAVQSVTEELIDKRFTAKSELME